MVIPKLNSVSLKPVFANYFNKGWKMLESFCIDDYMKRNRLLHWKQTYFLLCLFQYHTWSYLCSWPIPSPLHCALYLLVLCSFASFDSVFWVLNEC